MLNPRRAGLLGIVVTEHIETAAPVGSEAIVHKYALGISPATVRNEMVHLEEEGFLTHPHTSAGRVPSDKGYRFFVESLMPETELPTGEQRMIRHQFHQVARQIDEWVQLAAAVMSQMLRNAVVVTTPRTAEARLRQVQLVGIQDHVALLVVVFEGGRVRQEMLALPEPLEQGDLVALANRLNETLAGKTAAEIKALGHEFLPLEAQVVGEVLALADQEDAAGGEAIVDGVREVLRQPEFSHGSRLMNGLDLLDERVIRKVMPFDLAEGDRVAVIIGRENPQEAMQDWSVVLTRYGTHDGVSGELAVLGPTRMEYGRAISTVRFVSSVMSDLLSGYFGTREREQTEAATE